MASSFYGLLDLLSGTELNPGQNEIGEAPDFFLSNDLYQINQVQTAKQSCELLLKVGHFRSGLCTVQTSPSDHRLHSGLQQARGVRLV